jgi:hypothetical protein
MEDQRYIDQLKDIRNIMDRSSRFLSLSGLSGVMAGVYALCGAIAAHYIIQHRSYLYVTIESSEFRQIVAIAFAVIVLSLSTGVILSAKKAKKRKEKIWNSSSKRMLINLFIPLTTGGVFGILLLREQHYGLIAPVTLIFYGLGLVNASKYTFETLRSLGITFVVLGLINTGFPGYGLYFWAFGFGVLHILYGTIMYLKFDRKQAD